MKKCSVDGCDRGDLVGGLCSKHRPSVYPVLTEEEGSKGPPNLQEIYISLYQYYDHRARVQGHNAPMMEALVLLVAECLEFTWHTLVEDGCAAPKVFSGILSLAEEMRKERWEIHQNEHRH